MWRAFACLVAAGTLFMGTGQQSFAQQPTAPAKPANPFESVTPAPPTAQPAKPVNPFEGVPSQTPAAAAPKTESDVIDVIEFRGARRVPPDTMRAQIFTKKGDLYNEESLHRDLLTLWNTGRFDDIRRERERSETGGWIVRFVLVERPVIRVIDFVGAKSVTTSEILDRFRDRHVGLSVESTFDANRLQRARNVLQEFLTERGRQYAIVDTIVDPVPPSSVKITLKVTEGPKVRVGKINIEGNKVYSDVLVRRSMKALKPIGIPYSYFAENLFPKTYDATKLDFDAQMITQFYQKNGYFGAHVATDPPDIIESMGDKFRLPLLHSGKPGKRADLKITVEEGRLYHLNNINFTGVKLFQAPQALMAPIFGMSKGDIFSTEKLQKGIEQLRKLYGSYGYINFFSDPVPEVVPNSDQVNLTLNFDEGGQFFIRRIDFSGNTTTRDKVIRRELLVSEGDPYRTNLWELSILRLNQLGYFQPLKAEESVDVKTDTRTNTVDLTLRVKEQGKNTIQMSGGVSGISGSFLGFSYSTNNFLGLGETLSLSTSVGTRYKDAVLSFTEPYFLDHPVQVGMSVNISRFSYDQGREASVLAGANLIPLYNSLGSQNLLNYISNSKGFTAFASYLVRGSFARLGISYGYNIQSVTTLTEAAAQYYDYLSFQQINGQNQLTGIKTSSITPTYSYNSSDSPMTPTRGTRVSAQIQFAGSILGGNINQIEPVIDWAHWRKGLKPKHVIGMHILGQYVTGYGGKVAAPFNRFYMGGENDIRGFPLYTLSPIAYVPTTGTVNVLNADGTPRQQKSPTTGALTDVTTTIPAYQLISPGGDTKIVANFEYQIPIFGPLTAAAFFDAGVNRLSNISQLKLNPGRIDDLNAQFPEAAFLNRAVVAQGTDKIRMSTGIEFRILMPVFNQPFRVYWAYNPSRLEQYIQAPVVADRSYFPNTASFINSVATFGAPLPFVEKRSTFRFTIGRTF
ncbi:MAG: outer membrane protein assembly factor BamA [Acidobacteriota bacterium]